MLAGDKVMTVPGFKTQSWMTARMAIWCNLWSQQWSWLFWGSLSFQLCGVLFEAAISVNLVLSLSSQLSSGARYLVIRHMSSKMPMLKTNNRDQTKQRKQLNQSDQSLSLANITSYDLHQCRLFDTTATNRCHHLCCIQYYWQVTVLRILLQNLLGMGPTPPAVRINI